MVCTAYTYQSDMYLQSIPVCMQDHETIKILQILTKAWLFNWILAKFHQKPVLKQQKHQIYKNEQMQKMGKFCG